MQAWLDALKASVADFETWIMDVPSLWDRLDTTGKLTQHKAVKYDTVGIVARASGIALDRRSNDFYTAHGFELLTQKSGDVAARFKLRIAEVQNSIKMMQHLIEVDESTCTIGTIHDGEYVSFCESSIGELFMAIDIKEGVIERCFIRDPSFINWQAVHLMMRNDIIADFPLINKSCDLSYAGNDL